MNIKALIIMLAGLQVMGTANAISEAMPASSGNIETQSERDARMNWWREARFGMFIHWGLYAIPAGEWKGNKNHAEWIRHTAQIPVGEYDKFVGQFNPVKFDAGQWARMAKQAGMRYIVITSKHHDGFCLWDSKLTDYDVASTPFKRDILKELTEACTEHGVRMCFYHSIMDWHHPDYLPRREWELSDRPANDADFSRYITHMKGQLNELVKRYNPGVLWFDGEWENTWTHEMGMDLYNYVRSLKSDIIINNRVDKGRQGMQGLTIEGGFSGDFGTPEQEIPAQGLPDVDWESCMTMNNHWGWNKADKGWKTTEDLIHKLVDIASKGGNFLLNIGPKADGTFPEESIQRLNEIGQWMKVNSESIYGTTASPFKRLQWGRCTKKLHPDGATVYLHVFDWPTTGALLVPGLKSKVAKAYLLADLSKTTLQTKQSADGLVVSVPNNAPDPICSVVVLEVKGALDIEELLPGQSVDGSITLPAIDAVCHGQQIRYEPGHNRDSIGFWLDPNDWIEWVFRVTKPGEYSAAAEIAATSSGSFQVIVGDQKIKATAPNTGDYGKFITVNLGTIELKDTGKTSLSVKAIQDGWQPFNLKSISLKPAAR